MNDNLDDMKKSLEYEKQIFYTLLKRIPLIYTQYKLNPIKSHIDNYESLQTQIDDSSEKLIIIKNKILNLSDDLANNMGETDDYISIAKNMKKTKESVLDKINNNYGASTPREKQANKMYYVEGSLLSLQIIFVTSYVYLYYKLLKD
jgi:galactokinase/mevalonate kinase-like predicted kinase